MSLSIAIASPAAMAPFSIPMRGNEMILVAAAVAAFEQVFDPHEG